MERCGEKCTIVITIGHHSFMVQLWCCKYGGDYKVVAGDLFRITVASAAHSPINRRLVSLIRTVSQKNSFKNVICGRNFCTEYHAARSLPIQSSLKCSSTLLSCVLSRHSNPWELFSGNKPSVVISNVSQFSERQGHGHFVFLVYTLPPTAYVWVEGLKIFIKNFILHCALEFRSLQHYLGQFSNSLRNPSFYNMSLQVLITSPTKAYDWHSHWGMPPKEQFWQPAFAMTQMRARGKQKHAEEKTHTEERRPAKSTSFRNGDFLRFGYPRRTGKAELSYGKSFQFFELLGPRKVRYSNGRTWNN